MSSASALASWRSASSAWSCTSGLDSSSSSVSASTGAPGRTWMRSTRPAVSAVSQRMCSGTSVPGPFTWRSIGPRLTVSIHTPLFSTDGAAGLTRVTPKASSATRSVPPPAR